MEVLQHRYLHQLMLMLMLILMLRILAQPCLQRQLSLRQSQPLLQRRLYRLRHIPTAAGAAIDFDYHSSCHFDRLCWCQWRASLMS